jgi:glycosyltransferase involved in cell wall biosynthesis
MDALPAWLFWGLAALWVLRTLHALRNVRDMPRLAPRGVSPPRPPERRLVSVIVPARNEVDRIETTVRRLFGQVDVDLEVVVVDDRSTDGTGARLDALARELPGLTVRHVTDLPDGWLGKCHACHVGARGARGAWLLFTDADIWLAPDVIVRALGEAERTGAGHVALVPHEQPRGAWASAAGLAMQLGLADFAASANRGRGFIGVGAFNLVRRDAFERVGGYEALRLEVVDDIHLGFLLWKAGVRTRLLYGGPDVEVAYATSCAEFVHVVEKNGFAVYGYSVLRITALTLFYAALMLASLLGPLRGDLAGWACGVALVLPTLPTVLLARRQGVSPWPAPLMPFAGWVMLFAVLRSMALTLVRGGVRWRDTLYPLATLKAARRALHAHGRALEQARI